MIKKQKHWYEIWQGAGYDPENFQALGPYIKKRVVRSEKSKDELQREHEAKDPAHPYLIVHACSDCEGVIA